MKVCGFKLKPQKLKKDEEESNRFLNGITTNNYQPTTNNQQPTTNNQQPTTNNQQPTTMVEVSYFQMQKTILYVSICFCFFSFQLKAQQIPQQLSDKLNHTYDSICAKLNIKGSSTAVYIPNMGMWKRCFGVSSATNPINNDMLFSLGSNTKTYTSSVILKLCQDGLLNLDDTIGKWIVNFPNVRGNIKIRQILNHTSGIAAYTDNNNFWTDVENDLSKKWTPEEILPYIQTPLFNAGTSWAYSNSNYLIAGIIIKTVSTASLSTAYHNYIFTPSGLNKTILATEENSPLEFANRWTLNLGYPYLANWDAAGLSYDGMNSVSWAAGGLYATAEDNALFFDALFNRKVIIADSMLAKMKTMKNIGGGVGYGFGLLAYSNFNGRTVYGHGGSNLGANNENLYDPVNGCVISVLTNQDSVSNNDILVKLVMKMHKDLLDYKVGIDEINNDNNVNISVYPNPTKGMLNINSIELNENAQFILYNQLGETVFTQPISSPVDHILLDMNNGIYFYSIILENKKRAKMGKIVIAH